MTAISSLTMKYLVIYGINLGPCNHKLVVRSSCVFKHLDIIHAVLRSEEICLHWYFSVKYCNLDARLRINILLSGVYPGKCDRWICVTNDFTEMKRNTNSFNQLREKEIHWRLKLTGQWFWLSRFVIYLQ